jgi:hypothetical protein
MFSMRPLCTAPAFTLATVNIAGTVRVWKISIRRVLALRVGMGHFPPSTRRKREWRDLDLVTRVDANTAWETPSAPRP